MFLYLHNLVHALKLPVAKYQLLHRYSSTCIEAFPVALRGLYLYYCLLYIRTYLSAFYYYLLYIRTYWHAVHYLSFTQCILLLTLNGVVAWVLLSIVVAYDAAPLLRMQRNVIVLLIYSRITLCWHVVYYPIIYIHVLYFMPGMIICRIIA